MRLISTVLFIFLLFIPMRAAGHSSSNTPEVMVTWASWYGPGFHGHKTSSGRLFDMYNVEHAAHRYYPFETELLVTNLLNGKSVRVKIYDRGPFHEKPKTISSMYVKAVAYRTGKQVTVKETRGIDLSYAAAKELDMIGPDVILVSIEVVAIPMKATRK